jgi:hypothetical protein
MRSALATGAAVVGLALSGCGGNDEEATTSAAPPDAVEAPSQSATPPREPHLPPFALPRKFRTCMGNEGIDIPTSGDLPPGLDPAEFNRAMQTCAEFLHAGGG